jgi:8-oxo-dGTP diphosphatase
MVQEYVLGFVFDETFENVLLVKKNRPQWQKNRLNGIGGKIENFDNSAFHAMTREYREETGLIIFEDKWQFFCKMFSDYFTVHCFVSQIDLSHMKTFNSVTDEEILMVKIADLFDNRFSQCISNLSWLVPMALEQFEQKTISEVRYLD